MECHKGFKYLLFSSLFGETSPFLTTLFQMGWFNHQQCLYICVFFPLAPTKTAKNSEFQILPKHLTPYLYIPWKSKTKQRMVFRMIHVKDSLLPMGKVGSLDFLGINIYIRYLTLINVNLIHVPLFFTFHKIYT